MQEQMPGVPCSHTRRDFLLSGAAALGTVAPISAFGTGETYDGHAMAQPLAIRGTGWARKSNLNFGTKAEIARFTDLLRAGWYMTPTPTFLNRECQTYSTTNNTDANPNFQVFPDHCDIVAIWNGGPIVPALGNGSISSLMVRYDLPDGSGAPNAIGYYELSAKVPSVGGAWPAWWTIGHLPGGGRGSYTWGPEIDIFEFNNTDSTMVSSTLHKGGPTPSYCFMRSGTIAPGGNPPATPKTPFTTYSGSATYNCGSFAYAPGIDFAKDYHRYGVKIDTNHNISIWVDDILTGLFAAEQYCNDEGRPVSVELLINLAVGNGPDPAGSIDRAAFGGAGYAGPSNKFRLSLRNLQIWAPTQEL
jgi:hypothetical protein